MTPIQPVNLPDDDAYTDQANRFAESIDRVFRNSVATLIARLEDYEAPSTKRYTKDGANCGTGAGGFQEDNTCATGTAAADKPKDSSQKETVAAWADKEFENKEAASRFVQWFEGSKVVDKNGNPIVVYHGTRRPDRVGNVFDPERATSGPMPFFTDDPEIAGKYSTSKQDTSLERPDDYNGWFETEIRDRKRDLKQTWHALSAEERAELAENLPHVTNYDKEGNQTDEYRLGDSDEYGLAGKDHWDWTIQRESRGNVLDAAQKIWLESGGLFDREKEFLEILELGGLKTPIKFKDPDASYSSVYSVYLDIKNPLDTSNIPDSVVNAFDAASHSAPPAQRHGADSWDKDTRDPKKWVASVKRGDTYAWTSIPDFATDVLKEEGYDGIKDTGGKGGGQVHDVWIPFRSEQVKSSLANSTFDPDDPNINKTYTITLKDGANCGTGAGGFQSGNTCATGSAAADKPKGGKAKPSTTIDTSEAGKKKRADAAKELLDFIKEDRESERGHGAGSLHVVYAELIEKAGLSRQEFFLMLKENIGEIPDVSENLDWEEMSPAKHAEVHKLMRETNERSRAIGWTNSEHFSKKDRALMQGAFSHYNSDNNLNISPTSSLILASTPHPESFDRIQSNYEQGESLLDARPPNTAEGIPEYNRHRDDVFGRTSGKTNDGFIDSLTDRSAVITESAYVAADNFFDSVKDKTYAQRGEMAMREAHAAEYFLASSGIDAEVDPFVFMGHDAYAGKSPYEVSSVDELKNPKDTQDPESARKYKKTVQAAYEDIYAMKDAHDLLSGEYGEDLAKVSFRVGTRAFGDSKENQRMGRPSSSVAYYSPKTHSVHMFADEKGEEWLGDFHETLKPAGEQWTAGHKRDPILSTHVHETGHALHMAKLKKGKTPTLSKRHANMKASIDEYSPQAKEINWEWDVTVKNELSGYSATQPLEYVAEAFQVQKLNPARWNKIKDKPLPNYDPDSEDYPPGYWTYQKVYDELGGP